MYGKNKILNSFPPYLAKDVRRVLDMLVMKNDDISSRYYIVNLAGMNIAIPERVYMIEQTPPNMTVVQRNILDCIFTRHNNGFVRQRRTIVPASLSRLFAPLLQFEKWEIHTVFLHFSNFELEQKSWLSLLVKLCGVAI